MSCAKQAARIFWIFGNKTYLFILLHIMTSACLTIHQFAILLVVLLAGHCLSTPAIQLRQLKLLYYTASDDGSHHMSNTKIADALVRKGHDVTFLLSESCTKWRNASGADMFKFTVHRSWFTADDRERNLREMSRVSLTGELRGLADFLKFYLKQKLSSTKRTDVLFDFHLHECDSLLGDNATIHALWEERFDLLIGEDLSECQPLLAEILGIKFVMSGTHITPSQGNWYGIPRHPAYIPERQSGLSDQMNLLQRLKNTYLYFIYDLARRAKLRGFEDLQRKYNLRPEKRMPEMLAQAELWLFSGAFGLEFARPLQPNSVVIPSAMLGLPSEEKILQDQLEFLDAADEGAVLFTFGSHVNAMETAQAQMFANGLAKLKQRVMWQFTGSLSHVHIGKNTKVVKWMPQQKIMAHPNTKALLSHGGLNGMYEAAWHGLPVVGIPLFGDHFDNMERAVAKGMALQLDITTLTEDALYDTVTRVIDDPKYRERAQQISRLLRDDPVIPSEKAAHWIAHVAKYGGKHLCPRAADLNWIQYHLLDVYAFLVAILVTLLVVALLAIRVFLWLVCRNRKQQQKLKVN